MVRQRERTWVEISRQALRHNVLFFHKVVGPNARLLPVIKANAYGHDLALTAKALRTLPVWGCGVAYGSEALALRAAGYRGHLLVLSYWQQTELAALIRANVDIVVWDRSSWQTVQRSRLSGRARVHLKLDSGTSRIGFMPTDIPWLKSQLITARFQLVGAFSHLANSEEKKTQRTKDQILRFTTLIDQLPLPQGIMLHLACTAAALRYPEARFGLIRPGIGIYGVWPSSATKSVLRAKFPGLDLQPALSWKTHIMQLKSLPAGTAIGYGGTVTTKRPMTIALLPIGYSDGYSRVWSNRAWVMIRNKRAPVIGRISMNLTMVNVSNIPTAKRGDDVIVLGPGISADTLATLSSTLPYEVLTNIRSTIPRHLV